MLMHIIQLINKLIENKSFSKYLTGSLDKVIRSLVLIQSEMSG